MPADPCLRRQGDGLAAGKDGDRKREELRRAGLHEHEGGDDAEDAAQLGRAVRPLFGDAVLAHVGWSMDLGCSGCHVGGQRGGPGAGTPAARSARSPILRRCARASGGSLDLELHPQRRHPDGQPVERRRAGEQQAGARADALQRPRRRGDPSRHLGDGRVQEDARADRVGAERHRTRDVRGQAPFGRAARKKARARRHLRFDPVDPERPPVGAVQIPGDQIPAPPGVDQPGRLDPTAGARAVVAAVAERQLGVLAGGRGDGGQRGRVDGGAAAGERDDRRVQRREPTAQARRQHLFQLGERAQGDLLHPGDAAGGGGPQARATTASASSSSSSSGGSSVPAPRR